MSKIHFLFLMLGISNLTVVDRGIILGVITKNEFIKKRKQEVKPLEKKTRNKGQPKQKKASSKKRKVEEEAAMPLIEMENRNPK